MTPSDLDLANRYRGCLLGLAVGDAVGTTVEFRPRGSFSPVTGMRGGGPFGLQPGQWTDDTSMALCLASSLLECGGFDPGDQLERYVRWMTDGYWSSTGSCFDVGRTVATALERFRATGDVFAGSTNPRAADNGSLMRLGPVPLFYFPDVDAALWYAGESSRTTHGAPECIDACRLLAGMVCCALEGADKKTVLAGGAAGPTTPSVAAIAVGDYRSLPADRIRGTGYVVDCLRAAAWSFASTDCFEDAVLCAVNLGDDADTTAAVCGQLAGAYYGDDGIPTGWLDQLAMRDEIAALAERLRARSP